MSHRLCDIQLFHSDHCPTQSIYDYRQTARDIWQELDGEVEPWWRCCLLQEIRAAERRCGVCLCHDCVRLPYVAQSLEPRIAVGVTEDNLGRSEFLWLR